MGFGQSDVAAEDFLFFSEGVPGPTMSPSADPLAGPAVSQTKDHQDVELPVETVAAFAKIMGVDLHHLLAQA